MRSLTFAEVADQLGHLFWMSLVAITAGLISRDPWIGIMLMGFELCLLHLHVARHHPQNGWLRDGKWFLLGWTITFIGQEYIEPSGLRAGTDLFSHCIVALCWYSISDAIHRLVHEEWNGLCAGTTIAGSAVGLFVILLVRNFA